VLLTEKGLNELADPENTPMTTLAPVSASGRVAWIVAWPNEGRLVASTESPLTTIVGELALAEALATTEATSAAAAGVTKRRNIRWRAAWVD
jgi:hypothetical protein